MKKRRYAIIIVLLLSLIISGCCHDTDESKQVNNNENSTEIENDTEYEYLNALLPIFENIYGDQKNTNPHSVKMIVEELGLQGYVAVDDENKIDMTCPEQLEDFIQKHQAKEHAEITILRISHHGGFSVYDIITDQGEVSIKQKYYQYLNHQFSPSEEAEYDAEVFDYTEEGYLMIEGYWHSLEKYVLTSSEEEEHIALRVKPLDEKCRELNSRYIIPISYGLNNMFITDWNQDDYGDLDFYDVFALFYEETYESAFPYLLNDNLSIGEEYQVTHEEFEKVIMKHFTVSEKELRHRLRYDSDNKSYIYRPRGFYEYDYANIPYPEVVAYEENEDGTITLLVNAVYPNENSSRLFSHEVTVTEVDGNIQYLSNHIVCSENLNFWWHAQRYTDEEWEEYYRSEDQQWKNEFIVETERETDNRSQIEKGFDLSIDPSEEEKARVDLNDIAMEAGKELLDYHEDDSYDMTIPETITEQVVFLLSREGYIVKADNIYSNIENWELLEEFLLNAEKGKRGDVILYEIRTNGMICRKKYTYDGTDMYVLSSSVIPNKNGEYINNYCNYTRLKTWRYSENGWFCYKLCVPEYPEVTEVIDGSVLIRVQPISEDNRAASEKYLLEIGYQGNNILCSNWNCDSIEKLDFTGMYEYLYAMENKKKYEFPEDAAGIPADEFESLIMKYIPVSADQIRMNAAFDEEHKVYYWARLGCMTYAPTFFGTSHPEVTNIRENENGTITLTVNAVCEMMLNDEAVITHELTIKDNEDGSFMYLGNEILKNGVMNIPTYQYRIQMGK